MCGTFNFSRGSKLNFTVSASIQPNPSFTPSSLLLVRSCMPKQMPSIGTFSSNTFLFNKGIKCDCSKLFIPASNEPTPGNNNFVHQYLSGESYWAKNISINLVKKSIENSVCFSVFYKDKPVGFARVITDKATFGYIADVFIIEAHRGKGLSKWLMQTILDNEELQGFRGWMLGTKDAHSLYEKFGFKLTNDTTRIMRKEGMINYE